MSKASAFRSRREDIKARRDSCRSDIAVEGRTTLLQASSHAQLNFGGETLGRFGSTPLAGPSAQFRTCKPSSCAHSQCSDIPNLAKDILPVACGNCCLERCSQAELPVPAVFRQSPASGLCIEPTQGSVKRSDRSGRKRGRNVKRYEPRRLMHC